MACRGDILCTGAAGPRTPILPPGVAVPALPPVRAPAAGTTPAIRRGAGR